MRALTPVLFATTFLSLFFFPYPLTLLLSFLASLSFPWLAVALGVLADVLYFSPFPPGSSGLSLPLGTLYGAALSLLALFVRRFVKARIIT